MGGVNSTVWFVTDPDIQSALNPTLKRGKRANREGPVSRCRCICEYESRIIAFEQRCDGVGKTHTQPGERIRRERSHEVAATRLRHARYENSRRRGPTRQGESTQQQEQCQMQPIPHTLLLPFHRSTSDLEHSRRADCPGAYFKRTSRSDSS